MGIALFFVLILVGLMVAGFALYGSGLGIVKMFRMMAKLYRWLVMPLMTGVAGMP